MLQVNSATIAGNLSYFLKFFLFKNYKLCVFENIKDLLTCLNFLHSNSYNKVHICFT